MAVHHGSCSQHWPGWEGHGVGGTRGWKWGRQPSPVPTDGFALGRAPLAPPYAVVLISCSGLLAFIFLLLTCLCCKRGDVGFKVRCTRGFRVGRETPARPAVMADPEPGDGDWTGTEDSQEEDGLSQPCILPSPPLPAPGV